MKSVIDTTQLSALAQRILDPSSPPALRMMAAKGMAPGLRPGETLAVVLALSQGDDPVAAAGEQTLRNLPPPLLDGALASDLLAEVLDVLGPMYVGDLSVVERILRQRALRPTTVAAMALLAPEHVCELIATNEERMIATPEIIEKLYLNRHCRMSTSDRILELAVRHNLELTFPAFAQAKIAIQGERIAEASGAPTLDDRQFNEAQTEAERLRLLDGEDTHHVDDSTGEEHIVEKVRPLQAIWADLRPPAKIRLLQVATLKIYNTKGKEIDELRFDQKALRMIGIRDANPLVAVAALNAPGISDSEVTRISGLKNVAEEVLREIATNREWTRHYMVKFNLTANPRTPFAQASKWIVHLRETELKMIAKSREVSGAIQTAARQQLQRRGK